MLGVVLLKGRRGNTPLHAKVWCCALEDGGGAQLLVSSSVVQLATHCRTVGSVSGCALDHRVCL